MSAANAYFAPTKNDRALKPVDHVRVQQPPVERQSLFALFAAVITNAG